MITNLDKLNIKNIIVDPKFKSLELLANSICEDIRNESCLRDSEWDTLKSSLLKEGQLEGINRFLKRLYNEAQSHE